MSSTLYDALIILAIPVVVWTQDRESREARRRRVLKTLEARRRKGTTARMMKQEQMSAE